MKILNFRHSESASEGSFEASLYCIMHTEKYTHLKNEGAQAPSAPPPPPISPPMLICCLAVTLKPKQSEHIRYLYNSHRLGCIYSLDWTTGLTFDSKMLTRNGRLHWLTVLECCSVPFLVRKILTDLWAHPESYQAIVYW